MIGVAYFLSRREPLSRIIAPWVLHDLGNLLLAFVMLWAYMSFAQFLIIWVENLQHEIPWYLHRINGGWGVIAVALIVLQFALPFILLLSRAVKRKAGTLCAVAAAIALMHQIELFWFVAPTFHPDGFQPALDDAPGAARHRRSLVRGISRPTEGSSVVTISRSALHRHRRGAGLGATWLTKI